MTWDLLEVDARQATGDAVENHDASDVTSGVSAGRRCLLSAGVR